MINRAGTEYDIDNLVEDTYQEMYFSLYKKYNEEQALRHQLIKELEDLNFKEIIEEMNSLIQLKYKEIDLILDKYK